MSCDFRSEAYHHMGCCVGMRCRVSYFLPIFGGMGYSFLQKVAKFASATRGHNTG